MSLLLILGVILLALFSGVAFGFFGKQFKNPSKAFLKSISGCMLGMYLPRTLAQLKLVTPPIAILIGSPIILISMFCAGWAYISLRKQKKARKSEVSAS